VGNEPHFVSHAQAYLPNMIIVHTVTFIGKN